MRSPRAGGEPDLEPAVSSQQGSDPSAGQTRRHPSRRLLMIEQGGRGGVADYTAQLTRALAAQGWEVQLATAEDHRYAPASGVTVHRVFHYMRGDSPLAGAVRRAGVGRALNGLRFLAAIPRLMRLARSVDIVHAQGWETPPLGVAAIGCLRLSGAKIVQTSHNTFERGHSLQRSRRLLRRTLERLTARTIVHTKDDLLRMPAAMSGRVAVIPHGEYGSLARTGGSVDRDAARAALGIAPRASVTLLFGQLRKDKGLEDLLAAVSRVPELTLLIGGKDIGALAAAQPLLEAPELAGRVIVREGFLPMSEVAELFAAADTVSLPYQAASQSGVLLLSYGFHRPVVVYPVGGLIEAVLEGETGWICARADVDALADALAASVAAGASECTRRGEAGARLSDERYAWPVIARRTAELYSEVL
jgi:D-inositol-3-phosphate glycosyltransferase